MSPPRPAGEPVTLHLPAADLAELDELARASSRDPASLVSEAVATYLETQRWQIERIRRRMQSTDDDFATDEEVEAAFAAFG